MTLREEQQMAQDAIAEQGPSGSRPEEQTPKQTNEARFANRLAHMLNTMHQHGAFKDLVLMVDPATGSVSNKEILKMKSTFLATFTVISLITGSAVAQNTANTAGGGGITMSDHAKAMVHYVTTKPADTMSSKLVGADVYNNHKEKIGEIEDLVIDNGKTISGIVVSVGGFLGMGEHYVLVDPASMVMSNKDGSLTIMVDINKDNLKAAPSFSYVKHNNKKS